MRSLHDGVVSRKGTLKEAPSESQELPVDRMNTEERVALTPSVHAALRLTQARAASGATGVLSAQLQRFEPRAVDAHDVAATLCVDRALGVLGRSVDPQDEPLFNPAATLSALPHKPGDVTALAARLADPDVASAAPHGTLDRFYENAWVDLSEQGDHWVALVLDIGEAGQFDFGEAVCAVNTQTRAIHWLDPDEYL
jgi:hypothetical protein